MPSSDAILFDIDGTLVDSTYHHAMAWFRAFAEHDVVIPIYRLHRSIGMGGDKLVAHVAGDEVEERIGDEVRDGWRRLYADVVDEVPALPGAVDLVRSLGDAGYQVALASSGDPEFSERTLQRLGLGSDVSVLTTSADAEESKPEPDLLHTTLQRLDADRAVLIGDTPYDVESAAKAGLACLTVLTGGFGRDELEGAGAAAVVADVGELDGTDWEQHLSAPDV
jgi:phosphoglycolate phosphatase-like HAD superfamily hydrolase